VAGARQRQRLLTAARADIDDPALAIEEERCDLLMELILMPWLAVLRESHHRPSA
jgi:hypothetical protein